MLVKTYKETKNPANNRSNNATYTSYHDLNRALLKISIVFINFLLFILSNNDSPNHIKYKESIIGFLILQLCKSKRRKHDIYNISVVVILTCYLVLPVIQSLTAEICTDTIYFWYFSFHMFFVMNSVAFSIYNEKEPKKDYPENYTLKYEESINITLKSPYNNIYGYVFVTIGLVMLISRFTNTTSVFCFLTSSLICYVALPKLQEDLLVHTSAYKTLTWLFTVLFMAKYVNTNIYFAFLWIIGYMYTSFTVIQILK